MDEQDREFAMDQAIRRAFIDRQLKRHGFTLGKVRVRHDAAGYPFVEYELVAIDPEQQRRHLRMPMEELVTESRTMSALASQVLLAARLCAVAISDEHPDEHVS